MSVRTVIAAALLAGCAHPVPMATTADPTLCISDPTVVPSIVAPRRKRTGVCYPDLCFFIDHVNGRILERTDALDPNDTIPIRFDIRQSETETEVCNSQRPEACRTVKLPGVEDQLTVLPAISTDGFELYYVRREANQAFLDTIEISQQARRLGRVPLAIANPDDHELVVTRVGSAVLVRDRILTEHGHDTTNLLVDPHTGAKRVVDTAFELDAQTALVFERSRATIVNTRGIVTLAAYELPANLWPPSAGVEGPIAAFAHGSPPTLVMVTKRAFTRMFRLPVCR